MRNPTERVSVSGISTARWSLEEDLAFWTEAGIGLVGLPVVKLEAAGWDAGTRRVLDSGVRVGNVIGPGWFRLDDAAEWPRQRERFERVVGAAAALDADCVVFTTGRAGALSWEAAADALSQALEPCLAAAHRGGVALALEHTNSLRADVSFVHTLRDAIDLARRLGIGVCVETNACWLERGLDRTIADGADRFRLVQVSDFVIGTLDTPNRAVPGDGDIPLTRILGQVLAAGYAGVFDLELIGPRIEAEGYAAAIPRAVSALTRLLDELGA